MHPPPNVQGEPQKQAQFFSQPTVNKFEAPLSPHPTSTCGIYGSNVNVGQPQFQQQQFSNPVGMPSMQGMQGGNPFAPQHQANPQQQTVNNAAMAAPAAASGQTVDYMESVDLSIKTPKRFLRTTVGKIPSSSAMASSCKLPIGAVIRPLAPLPFGHSSQATKQNNNNDNGKGTTVETCDGVAVVNPSTSGIVRCKRCRTYINPFVAWIEHGRRWICNLCGQKNDVPSAYFCHLDERGIRRDRDQRPELSQGVVEFIAPSEYMVRPPQAPVYFFVIDVSAQAVRSGMVKAAAEQIKKSLGGLPGGERTMVGVITFDKSVHFYNLKVSLKNIFAFSFLPNTARPTISPTSKFFFFIFKSGLSQPQMLVVSDLKELFIPVPDDLLVNLSESRGVFEAFLDGLPGMYEILIFVAFLIDKGVRCL